LTLGFSVVIASTVLFGAVREAKAADLTWKGFDWNITNGGMAGVAEGSPDNVSVDASGYLHLKIVNNGGTWTAAELFTTKNLGFGTYQWQVDGPIDTFDKNVVLGLYPYGPAGGIGKDGTNEIDIEYSRWGNANGVNGDWTDYPNSGKTIGETSYSFSLNGGTASTSRFVWTSTSITSSIMSGYTPVTSNAGLLQLAQGVKNPWTYAPSNPSTNIPQNAMPLGMNLWCFGIPSDGKNVEVIIRDFVFVAEGTDPNTGNGGSGGGTSTGGSNAGGSTGTGGRNGHGGNPGNGGTNSGGTTGNAGNPGMGGATNTGGTSSNNGGSFSNGGSFATGGSVSSGGSLATGGSYAVGGAANGGAAQNGAGTSSVGSAGRPDTNANDSGSCSVANASHQRGGNGLVWILAAPLFLLGRRLRAAKRAARVAS